MKIYVAGKWENRAEIKRLMTALQSQGHTITCDWTTHEYAPRETMVTYLKSDIKGVQDCEAYIGIFIDSLRYRGALVELGAALALNKSVFIVGHAEDSCIFMLHPNVWHFRDERDCLDYFSQKVGL